MSTQAGSKSKKSLRAASTKKRTSKKRASATVSPATVKKVAAKKKASSTSKVVARTQTQSRLPLLRDRLQLSAVSAYRFPISNDHVAAGVARYAGIFFVVAGTLLALWNIALSGVGPLTFHSSLQDLAASSCSSPSECQKSYGTSGAVSDQPVATIDTVITDQGDTTKVEILTTVEGAQSIETLLYDVRGKSYLKLGDPTKSGSTWKAVWTAHNGTDAGSYRIQALITNDHGTYLSGEADFSIVVAEEGSQTATTQTATPSSTQGSVTPEATIAVSAGGNLNGIVGVTATVPDAVLVEFYIQQTKSNSPRFIGTGSRSNKSPDTWSLRWNTEDTPNGSYNLFVGIANDYGSYTSGTTDVFVSNTVYSASYGVPIDGYENTYNRPSGKRCGSSSYRVEKAGLCQYLCINTNDPNDTFILEGLPEFFFKDIHVEQPDGSYQYCPYPNGGVSHCTHYPDDRDRCVLASASTVALSYDPVVTSVVGSSGIYNTLTPTKTTTTNDPVVTSQTTTDSTDNTIDDRPAPVVVIQPDTVATIVEETNVAPEQEESLTQMLTNYNTELDPLLERYATVYRESKGSSGGGGHSSNPTAETELKSIKDQITALQAKVTSLASEVADETFVTQVMASTKKIAEIRESNTIRNEDLIRARAGDEIFRDSDNDGISNYDEVALYGTDPYSADSDNDGYIDGVEVLGGFSPTHVETDTLVKYESPKNTGLERSDILAVSQLTPLTIRRFESPDGSQSTPVVFSGEALPNSFVTVYLFSTPIVVTVKTNDDGSWSYLFEKDLEDGEHEVYVGITDNAGRIVAKSSPFRFIKTAEAFTPITAASTGSAQVGVADATPNLLSGNSLLVILSVIVVLFGLLLLLFGMHLQPKAHAPKFT
ncbi:hypothetical protein KC727_02465 [Candidatus Kaiserbacteria bacterium]|nr:hypothetical protein [Candidatus Kaiserbacteria bacterium]